MALYVGGLVGVACWWYWRCGSGRHDPRSDSGRMAAVLATSLPCVYFFLPYTLGWAILLRGTEGANNAGLGYLFWVTTVREAIDRLLPVASVGGGVIGVRLLRWRGLPAAQVGASIIVEILLTLFAVYLFFVVGVLLLFHGGQHTRTSGLLLALVLTLPIPLGTAWLFAIWNSISVRTGRGS